VFESVFVSMVSPVLGARSWNVLIDVLVTEFALQRKRLRSHTMVACIRCGTRTRQWDANVMQDTQVLTVQ
jgi:hypothetical protein